MALAPGTVFVAIMHVIFSEPPMVKKYGFNYVILQQPTTIRYG